MTPNDSTLRNASVVLAGCACLVPILARVFYPYSWLPVRGAWLASLLVVPLLCLWCGMLLHYRVGGKTRIWMQVLCGLIAAYMFYLSRLTVDAPRMDGVAASYLFAFFLGVALPWDHLRANGDHLGVKSAVLCVLGTVIYTALYVVWMRLSIEDNVMVPECDDMRQFLIFLMTNMLPLAMVPPLLSASEFAFSRAGQWLGGRKWFRWAAIPAALYCFLGAWFRRPSCIALDISWDSALLIRVLVQPVFVYLVVVIWRIIRGIARHRIDWKEVFHI